MYFLAKIRGKHLVDPFSNNDDLLLGSDSDSNNPYEKDSQDSNRESADQNDYPDEELVSEEANSNECNNSDGDDSDRPRRKKK